MIDITQLPGMAGEVGGIVSDTVTTIEHGVLCVATASLFDCFDAIINAALLIWDLFTLLFPGRPKVGPDSATDHIALFYIPSGNPVVALYGLGVRELETVGVTLSSRSGPGYVAEQNLANALKADLIRQFDGPKAPKLTLRGVPVTGTLVHYWYFKLAFSNPNPDSDRVAIAERQLVDDLYRQLVNQKYIDPKTGFPVKPPPGGCPAGQYWDGTQCKPIPKCPAGYHWDGAKCVKDPPPPPPPGGGQPDQDEFQDCCDETLAALANLNSTIGNLSQSGIVGGGDSACCDEIVTAIGSVAQELTLILSPLSKLAAGGLDLAPIVTALGNVTAAVKDLRSSPTMPVEVHITNTEPLAVATVNAPPPDLSEVVKQLATIAQQGDVKQTVLDYLVREGYMTGADAQVISGASWADAVVGLFRTSGWNALKWVASWAGLTWDGKSWHFAGLTTTVISDISRAIDDALRLGSDPVFPIVKGLIDGVVKQLEPARAVAIGEAGVDPDLLLAKTLAPAFILNGVALVAGYLGWELSEQLREYVDWAAEFVGLVEVKELQVGARMRYGPVRVAEMNARRTYRQELPGANQLYSLAARGLMTVDRAAALNGYNGIPDELHRSLQFAAYSGIAPRQLLRLMNTGLFTDADYRDELDFAGVRPASQDRFLLAAPYLATTSERNGLRSEYEKAYSAGLLTDQELTDLVDSAEHNTSRDFLILDKVRMTERIALSSALEKEYTTMYRAGLLAHDAYVANLQGIGLQAWKVNALVGIADANRAATLARQMAAAERALERATAAAERKASMKAYVDGLIDVVALTAALVGTGLTAAQAAAWAELAALQKRGGLRWVYGVQLPAAQATLLKARVTALLDQHKKKLLSDAFLLRDLEQLGIPSDWRNALLATADAVLAGKGAAKLVPVLTS